MLSHKEVVGPEKGYLSQEAYLIILITWLQKNFHLPKAQDSIQDLTPDIKKERIPENLDVNVASMYTLRGQFGAEQMSKLDLTGVSEKPQSRPPYIKVDYTFIDTPEKLRMKMGTLAHTRKLTQGKKESRSNAASKSNKLSVILMKLARKLVLSLGRKDLVFNPKRGRIYSKRSNRLLVSIKDPFIKEINYGCQMRDKEKLKHLVSVLKSFIKAGAECSVDDFYLDRGDAALSFQDSSHNQTDSASPPDGLPIEESKIDVTSISAPNLAQDQAQKMRQDM